METVTVKKMHRLGHWLPQDRGVLSVFAQRIAEHIADESPKLNPEVAKLEALINSDPFLRMNLILAINQAKNAGHSLPYSNIPELISLVNGVLTMAPSFSHSELVGCPLNAILDWIMCVPAGYEFFRSRQLNRQLKLVLNEWKKFLDSADSGVYLNSESPKGWFCEQARETIHLDEFIYDESKPFYGFTSWNDFFTRHFKAGMRPISEPDNNGVIISACEATPYRIEPNAKLKDRFWMKGQPYSLQDIFTAEKLDLAQNFENGSVYQAFLSAYNYHRWHAPISGTIVDVYSVDGTYYSEAESAGADPAGPNDSQGYLTAVAARMIIIIESDDEKIGKVACVFVGMAEVSSCISSVKTGEHVVKGQELGYFQFGGSTHCLIFQKDVIDFFTVKAFSGEIVKLNSAIALTR
ncbi:phosphatidylserine decarboxylase family protein [Prolixibacteraceae bacterium JC049]|nr:phosphatidylserine decarboxylase family protein [Prolixibacteraceae bacterium JC049]